MSLASMPAANDYGGQTAASLTQINTAIAAKCAFYPVGATMSVGGIYYSVKTVGGQFTAGKYGLSDVLMNQPAGTLVNVDGDAVTGGGGGSGAPPLLYWKRALNDMAAGTRDINIGFAGDSIKAGAFGNGVVSNVNNRQFAYSNLLAKLLAAAGYNVNVGSVFGDQNFSGALSTNTYNPEVALGAGWVYQGSGGQESLGGNWCSNSGSANSFDFTPRKTDQTPAVFDRVAVFYITNAGYGGLSVGVDGGAAISNFDTSVPGSGVVVKSTTVVVPGAPAAHTVNVRKQVAGDGKAIVLVGIMTWNSTIKQINLHNTAIGSSVAANWNKTTNGYSCGSCFPVLGCDLWFLDETVNDSNVAVPDVNYATDVNGFITKANAASADVILCSNYPIGTANGLANQFAVTKTLAGIAATAGKRFVDNYSAVGTFATLNALGWFPAGEQIHGNLTALQDAVNRYYAGMQ